MRPDLFWIEAPWPGRLAIAARPRGAEWPDDEMRALRAAGVDVLVSLLEAKRRLSWAYAWRKPRPNPGT
jgi:hypothetical protein